MAFVKSADKVVFVDDNLESAFNSLDENGWLKKSIIKTVADLKENAFCGERIKKKQIPKDYIKRYGIDNLLWYPLPNAWRLVYSIISEEKKLLAVIVDYYNHKDYERKFNY
ncbi:MAG: hypothetical protein AABY22_19325 [Nanoarchaeota archaeon]